MNDDPLPSLRDTLLRRDLTPAEESRAANWIQSHPELAASWRDDVALARQLRRLPPVAVPSNFTSLVLAAVQREPAAEPSTNPGASRWSFWRNSAWRGWRVPATAVAVVAITAASWQGYARHQQREQVRNLSTLRALKGLSPANLADFEAIQRFGATTSPVDFELLAALE